MKDNDGILILLGDLKDLLWGIALLILAIFLFLAGLSLGGPASLLLIPGFLAAFCGFVYAFQGHRRHTVVEKQD